MLAVIGSGQAGSNIAAEAERLGLLAGAINYSQKDLDAVNVKHKLRLLGSEGVGKNRDDAIKLFQDQWETAISFIKDNFANEKIIAFAFSSSGGSGSGISPILLDMAINLLPDKTFIALVILPDLTESETAQINCLATFEELSQLDLAVFPIDNQQIRNQNPSIGKNKLFEISNKNATSLIYNLSSYTNKHSKNGNFDEKDLITVLKTRGIATISETPLSASLQTIDLTIEGLIDKITESWQKSIFAPLSSDKAISAAIVFDGQENLMDFIRLDSLFSSFHLPPIEVFEGYYHEHSGKIITLLSGLRWSFNRLKDIELTFNNKQDQNEKLVDKSYKMNLNISRTPFEKKQEEKVSVLDILSKYNR
ncbi:FtsZ/tubulin family protein [Paenibacillus pini]|uniref:FtsZ cell division protein n=1 Tax=Paenibacillus pini JCM 16418 TaxID=1236976 RepID=W7YQR5_9BACL|nr:hypothetical protein [Paenibacillus pini]GAF10907.1 FtsZ cell division protein [Paenibacillus pini JCM 16418]